MPGRNFESAAFEKAGGVANPTSGIGSGGYKIVEHEAGVRTAMERFANYWDSSRGHADGVEILTINDDTARTAAIQAGQVHMIDRVDPKIVELLKSTPEVIVERASGPGHYVFIMHCDKAPFDNNDLRMALKLAINRQEQVDKILGGLGSRGNDFPINSAYPFFDDSIEQREYDAAKAAEFYKKSGHDGSPIVLRTAPGAFPGAVEAAQLFQQSAAAAGIPLEVKVEPDDGYWSNVWNVEPFCASYWGGRPVQDQMYSTAYLSTADWNDTKFKNARFDELLIAARVGTGVGAAALRVLAVSIVRDRYEGRTMARVMSFSFLVFLGVPILAPSLGQLIMLVGPWRWIFAGLALFLAQ